MKGLGMKICASLDHCIAAAITAYQQHELVRGAGATEVLTLSLLFSSLPSCSPPFLPSSPRYTAK